MIKIPQDLSMHSLWDDLAQVLLRRKRLIALTALTMTSIVFLGLNFMSDKYEAKASLLVKLGGANADVPLTVEKGGVYTDGVRKEEINSYVSLLLSRPVLASTIDQVGPERFKSRPEKPRSLLKRLKLALKSTAKWGREQLNTLLIKVGLRPELEERELLILLLDKSLTVALEKDTNVIALSLKLGDPLLAQELLEVLIDVYLERHISLVQQEGDMTEAFDRQVQEDREQLRALQDQRDEIRETQQIGAINEQQRNLASRIGQLEEELLNSQRILGKLKAEKNELISQSQKVPKEILTSEVRKPSRGSEALKDRLTALQITRAQQAAQFAPGAPPLLMLEDEITLLERASAQQDGPETGEQVLSRNPLLTQIESRLLAIDLELHSREASAEIIQKQRSTLTSRLLELNAAETNLQMIDLEEKVAQKRFLKHASRQQEAKARELLNSFQIANLTVLSEPSFSWKPVAPKRLFLMLGGLVGGLAIGLGLALFLEWQNQIVREPEDLQGIEGVPLLGSLNHNP